VEIRCSTHEATWGVPLTGKLQLWAGHKPLWVERMRMGLRPEFCLDLWDRDTQETVSWSSHNIAPERTMRLRFTLDIRPGSVLGGHTLLETEIQLWKEVPWLVAVVVPVLPSAEFTLPAQLLQELGGLEPPTWSRPPSTFDAVATFAPGDALRDKLDEVVLLLLREREGMSGELILNERERTPMDYLRAARGRDKRVLRFRWALGDVGATQAFFANALRPYVDTLVQFPIPASAAPGPAAQLPVPVSRERAPRLEEFLMPAPSGVTPESALEFILPESGPGPAEPGSEP
jgi:hypothetical protein